jgi:hypothetical protein
LARFIIVATSVLSLPTVPVGTSAGGRRLHARARRRRSGVYRDRVVIAEVDSNESEGIDAGDTAP